MTDTTDNPLLHVPFEIPFDRIRPEHVEPAVDVLVRQAQQRIEDIAAAPGPRTWDNTLGALEDATEELERAMGVVGHLETVATTPELREAYNAVQPKVSEFFSGIPLHEGLWKALQAYAKTEEAKQLDPVRKRLLDKTLDEFRRHGANLDAEGKKRLSEIDVELGRLTTRFAQNVLDSTNQFELVLEDESKLAGLPQSARDAARESAQSKGYNGWRFTLQAPSVIPVLTYLEDRDIREQIWRAFTTRATEGEHDNRPLITQILKLRQEKATLLGYDNFGDLVLEDRMAGSSGRARSFVDQLRERTEPFFDQETEALAGFRRELEGSDAPELKPWDVGYYAEKQRQARFDFDEEELRPYFPADRVLDGLFQVVQRLYDIRIEPHELPVWNDDVRSYAVRDADGTMLAAFYADLHPREDKRGGAWMNELITGDGQSRPHLGLFCANVSPPSGDKPALLTHQEVQTLFHEFGHLMHLVLSRVPVRSLAGPRVAWDFVELPSQLMENWTWEREALDLFARHYETNEPIPEELYQKMHRARTYRSATGMMRQIGLASVDLALHLDYDPDRDGDVQRFARGVLQRHSATPLPEEYSMVTGFHHLFGYSVGYASGYYSYKWAEVLEADVFSRFKQEGIFNKETARSFRDCILSKGDSEEAGDLFRCFMGRDPSIDPLFHREGLR
jgi:oligopeptidase A